MLRGRHEAGIMPFAPEAMTSRWPAMLAYVGTVLVFLVGAAYPWVADWLRPGPVRPTLDTVLRSAGWAAGPTAALLLCIRWAGTHRLATWTALLGTLLILVLGLALYAAALRPDARPSAPLVAFSFVPLRQLAGAAVVGWAVWLARHTR